MKTMTLQDWLRKMFGVDVDWDDAWIYVTHQGQRYLIDWTDLIVYPVDENGNFIDDENEEGDDL